MPNVNIEWGKGSFDRIQMRPMTQPTWESLLALPDDTEVLALFVLPFGISIRGLQFYMNAENRTKLCEMRDDVHTGLPSYVTYLLPPITVPEPEDFFAPRKDADNG
jgi:hypothetical protein